MTKSFNLDLRSIGNLKNFSGIIPLFPLASVVFFPNTLLPLHIFEQRYRQMMNDVMDSERIIGMILLKPGWEKSYAGNPEVYGVACMGKIVNLEPLEDGRFNTVLFGLKRVKVLEIVKEHPYRAARVEILEDKHGASESVYGERIRQLIVTWNEILGKEQESHKINVDTELPLENLTDAVASSVISNVFEKQLLLEETNVQRRAERVLDHLETKFKIMSMVKGRSAQILEKRNFN